MERLAIISILSFLFTLIGTKYLKEYLEKKKSSTFPMKEAVIQNLCLKGEDG